MLAEELVVLAVSSSVVREVVRCSSLPLSHDVNELFARHRLQRVVPRTLLADGG